MPLSRNRKISFPCPKCKKVLKKTIARLQKDDAIICPACSGQFRVDIEKVVGGVEKIEESLTKLRRKRTLNL